MNDKVNMMVVIFNRKDRVNELKVRTRGVSALELVKTENLNPHCL